MKSLFEDLPCCRTLPLCIGSDRDACISGEAWKGAARGCRHALLLIVGAGIGAGILVEGRPLQGFSGIDGAIGWVGLTPQFLPPFAASGCLEYFASGMSMVRQVKEWLANSEHPNPFWQGIPVEAITFREIFDAYGSGDPLAIHILDRAILMWGMAVANLVSLFNPERVLLCGGLFGPAKIFLNRIQAEAARWAQPQAMKQVTLTLAELDRTANLLGAGRWVLDEIGLRDHLEQPG